MFGFERRPRNEALAALAMADAHYGGTRYRVIEDHPTTGFGPIIREGGGRPRATVR